MRFGMRGGVRAGVRALAGVLAALVTMSAGASPARAQVVQGTVRTQQGAVSVPGARVSALDSLDTLLAETTTDAKGRFRLVLRVGKTFRVTVRKVGWRPSATDWLRASVTDTLSVELLVPADPVSLDTVEIRALAVRPPNQLAFDEAKRRGWKLYPPEMVERYREVSMEFTDLLRFTQAQGIVIPARANECIRSLRTRRCLVFVVDGVPSGTSIYVSPRDVYFFAVLTATESAVQWGDRAPWGAIVIYTRMYGDKKRP